MNNKERDAYIIDAILRKIANRMSSEKFTELKERLDSEIKVSLEEVNSYIKKTSIKGEKGDKGDTGPIGPQGKPGVDGKTPIKGKDYFDGKDGVDGLPGFTSPQDIVLQLQSLKGDERLSAEAIKDLPTYIEKHGKAPVLINAPGGQPLPDLAGNSGKYLNFNGNAVLWSLIPSIAPGDGVTILSTGNTLIVTAVNGIDYIPGKIYHSPTQNATAASTGSAANTLYFTWFPLKRSTTWATESIQITSGGSPVSTINTKLGIWSNNGASNLPGNVLFDPPTAQVGASGPLNFGLSGLVLPAPGVWVGLLSDGGATALFAATTTVSDELGDIDVSQVRAISRYQANVTLSSPTMLLPNGSTLTFTASTNAGPFIKLTKS